jgi:hypothetical protein
VLCHRRFAASSTDAPWAYQPRIDVAWTLQSYGDYCENNLIRHFLNDVGVTHRKLINP